MTRHAKRLCKRCGWIRTTNSKTPDLCTACRRAINNPNTEPPDHIEWVKTGLVYRGIIHPQPKDT